jgi:hypothetical protein
LTRSSVELKDVSIVTPDEVTKESIMLRKRSALLLVASVCALVGPGLLLLRAATTELKVEQSWDGIIKNEKLLRHAPTNGKPLQGAAGFVAEEKAWVKLWKAWRGDERVPEVNFAKELVLVFTLGGPNKVSPPELRLDDNGELKARAVATLIGGRGFCYKIVVVRREGIRSVNATPVPKE